MAEVDNTIATWMDIQCAMINTAQNAVLVLCSKQNESNNVYYWPQETPSRDQLTAIANQVLEKNTNVFYDKQKNNTSVASPASIVGFPLRINQKIIASIAVEVSAYSVNNTQTLQQVLDIGAVWLNELVKHKVSAPIDSQIDSIFNLTISALEKLSFHASATALVTELATKFNCSRVSLGVVQENAVNIKALSHSAIFNKKNELIKNIQAAMIEAVDAQDTIIYSSAELDCEYVTRAHNKLLTKYDSQFICSVPLINGQEIFGVISLEKENVNMPENFRKYMETIGVLIGPILALKYKEERPLTERITSSIKASLNRLFGPKNAYTKFATAISFTLAAFLTFSTGTYKISADSYLEGSIQRAIVAPIDGYIKEASVRAGDIVSQGDVLALIDDKDLRIERLKWDSERVQRVKQYRLALASHEKAQARILSAQLQQAEAKVALFDEQIARTRIVAPLDGIIVSGDLSQSLGSPAKRGDQLFTVAPLNQYRVILNVDETEIGDVQIGQHGHLVLSGTPNNRIAINVEKITPVSVTDAGQNFFRVEASLLEVTEKLRPGMKGIAKVQVEQRRLIWIWTHKLVDWLRLWTWTLFA